jgi:predicted RNA-binding protein with PUA-like domain
MHYWLLKSEPSEFSITDLINAKNQTTPWEGVRNYQARNMMRAQMKKGDLTFFYHSNCDVPGIVGIVKIVQEGYPDRSAFNATSKYFDPKSSPDMPTWYHVDVQYVRTLKRFLSLPELKQNHLLRDLALVRRGNRLSVMPVSAPQWQAIVAMESKTA